MTYYTNCCGIEIPQYKINKAEDGVVLCSKCGEWSEVETERQGKFTFEDLEDKSFEEQVQIINEGLE